MTPEIELVTQIVVCGLVQICTTNRNINLNLFVLNILNN